jgi:hypothetical protein
VPPLIVAKVNNKGTTDQDDDKIVGGATFEVRLDDGDGEYEPDSDDGAPIAELDSPDGYSVYTPPSSGDYWVKEVTPPAGLTTAPAMLVEYTLTPQNCVVVDGDKTCKPDDDDTGGFTIAVIEDSPVGKPLPQTDAASVTDGASPFDMLWVVYAGLAGTIVAAAVLAMGPRRRNLRGPE